MKKYISVQFGFTMVELLVTISIIAILSAIVYANFSQARAAARDDIRKTALKELQLAVELYKAQNGIYPAPGCVPGSTKWQGTGPATNPGTAGFFDACNNYIAELVSGGFIAELPRDPNNEVDINGFIYATNAARTEYKIMANQTVEVKRVQSYQDEFARCPSQGGGCGTATPPPTYAIYSPGAATW